VQRAACQGSGDFRIEHRVRVPGQKPIIGLCGGIAAGKSVVADLLSARGAGVIDSDALSHAELLEPDVIQQLRAWWGSAAFGPDGRVDRSAVASIVFADPRQNERLKALIYPRIAARRRRQIAEMQRDPAVGLIVLNSPLLFEAGLDAECDAVVFVDADRAIRLERAARTRGWSADELDRREKAQIPLDNKRARADYIVSNNSGIEEFCRTIEELYPRLLAGRSEA